ncbi:MULTISPECIES: hypothetical protein [unclassified Arcicella]|nr:MULTISPECIES: hypothetical protein [unclassified Arcicella]MDR6564288.1 hypothetical protein [Arcicella sp. BE51]MDR6811465.1 hypothetical protein [Arcicella sp. BE140]MDR6826005.1 hypothetical protein [Arcicella sp. BE139]
MFQSLVAVSLLSMLSLFISTRDFNSCMDFSLLIVVIEISFEIIGTNIGL